MARRNHRNRSALAQDVERIKEHFPGSTEVTGTELAKVLRMSDHPEYKFEPDQLTLFTEE